LHQRRNDQRSDEGNQRDRNAAQLRTTLLRRARRGDLPVDVMTFAADNIASARRRALRMSRDTATDRRRM
jgi:hypothetical protein